MTRPAICSTDRKQHVGQLNEHGHTYTCNYQQGFSQETQQQQQQMQESYYDSESNDVSIENTKENESGRRESISTSIDRDEDIDGKDPFHFTDHHSCTLEQQGWTIRAKSYLG